MTEGMELCGCSEEYGPCEQHCQVLFQREGAALRSADELAVRYLEDAVSLVPDCLSPYGSHVLTAAKRNLIHGAWLTQTIVTGEELSSVCDQVESELGVAGYSTYWDDGYRIVKITGGPFAEVTDA